MGGKDDESFLEKAYQATDPDETKPLYDTWADTYDEELADAGYAQPERCAKALKTLMPRDGRILDIGCGTGLSGLALKQAGYSQIDGCDFSPGMLEKAADLNVYGRLFEADLNKPPLDVEDATYDAITAVGVFSMLHIDVSALDEFLRAVKPKAPIVIGLNDKYYQMGHLTAKLDALSALGRLSQLGHEHGEHLPGTGMTGWVIKLRKA
ncbi:MAG: class I SAM-dependent methyltransferase [Pseudomonadota bacterium]